MAATFPQLCGLHFSKISWCQECIHQSVEDATPSIEIRFVCDTPPAGRLSHSRPTITLNAVSIGKTKHDIRHSLKNVKWITMVGNMKIT